MNVPADVVEKLRLARRRIIDVAGDWQALGIDTWPLSAPLAEIQRAIYLLESLDPRERDDDHRLVRLGWDLRDYYNVVRAACERMEGEEDPATQLRFADFVWRAADECVITLDRMEPLFPDE